MVAGESTNLVTNVLESQRMKELIDKLKERYDYVLLDTPPIIAVSDAIIISKIIRSCYLYCCSRKSEKIAC